jgi:hypothetical protein
MNTRYCKLLTTGVANTGIGEYGTLMNSISSLSSYLSHILVSGFPEQLATVVMTDARIWKANYVEMPYVTFICFFSTSYLPVLVTSNTGKR